MIQAIRQTGVRRLLVCFSILALAPIIIQACSSSGGGSSSSASDSSGESSSGSTSPGSSTSGGSTSGGTAEPTPDYTSNTMEMVAATAANYENHYCEVTIEWTLPPDWAQQGNETESFIIYYGEGWAMYPSTTVNNVWRGATVYTVINLTPSVEYCFRISQYKPQTGESHPSNPVCATPMPNPSGPCN